MRNILLLAIFCFYSTTSLSQDIQLESFATGFSNPVNAAHAGDSRLFVVEQDGVIKILNSDGSVNTTPFLDIDPIVSSGGERGLLSVAFHPNYIDNGYFYVNYTNNSGDTVVSRFTRNTEDTADPNSELILLTIDQPFSNHNGGDMHFSPNDGYLYIATGDGGSGGDPLNKAQDLNSLLGKMLRIDVDNTTVNPDLNYAIPPDNPFIDNPDAMGEIWSYGLRNPWKFSFDRLNGDMWIADVGQSNREEINRQLSSSAGGENYGWRCYEGNSIFETDGCGQIEEYTFPVAEYAYGGNPFKCSITGGYRYRGSLETTLQNLYFFADFCSGEIGYVQETSPDTFQLAFSNSFSGQGFASFVEDVNGELFIIGRSSGNISRIRDISFGLENQNLMEINVFPNPASQKVSIDFQNNDISSIKLFDIQGKGVFSSSNISDNLLEISVENFEKGIYLLEMTSDNGIRTVKKLLIN